MLRFLGRLILIPLGIAFAALAALMFVGVVAVAQPSAAEALTGWALGAFQRLWTAIAEGEEAIRQYGASLIAFSRIPLVVLLLPVGVVAAVAEVFSMRAWLLQALLAGLLTALVPFALAPEIMARSASTPTIMAVLGTTGVVAGTVYWLIAGRTAGPEPKSVEERATVRAPRR